MHLGAKKMLSLALFCKMYFSFTFFFTCPITMRQQLGLSILKHLNE